MPYRIEQKLLSSIIVLVSRKHTDHRGYFQELIRFDKLASYGVPDVFAQINHSRSIKGVIRGLHAQLKPAQGKLLHVVRGAIQLVELDIRPSSSTFGQHVSIDVSDENGRIVYIPPGFANGFCVKSEFADVMYHCTTRYNPEGEIAVHALDPALGIDWCEKPPLLSLKDSGASTLAEHTELLRLLESDEDL